MSIVYLLTNPAMPGLVKIGHTKDLAERMQRLYASTGVPLPFQCYYAVEVGNHVALEKRMHSGLVSKRINPGREFFEMNPEEAKQLLQIAEDMGGKVVSPTDGATKETVEIVKKSTQEKRYGNAPKWFAAILDEEKANNKTQEQVLKGQMVNSKPKTKNYRKLKGVCCFTFAKLNETMSRKKIADKYNVALVTVENAFERKINPIKEAFA